MYAYRQADSLGWELRRCYCVDCATTTIGEPTLGVTEPLVRAWLGSIALPRTRTHRQCLTDVELINHTMPQGVVVTSEESLPSAGESFTEFYLLTETEDGELVADDYPTNFTVGEAKPVVVGASNQEQAPVNYTMIAELQEVQLTGSNGTNVSVTNASELGRYSVRLGDNETDQRRFDVRPTTTGERLRVAFLLYRGEPPADPSVETAYRETHLWVNVTPLQG